MRQFDVCPASGRGIQGGSRLVLVLQHDHVSHLATIVVAPLFVAGEMRVIRQLHPHIRIAEQDFVVAIDRLASLPRRQLGDPIVNVLSMDYEVRKAFDFLFAGF